NDEATDEVITFPPPYFSLQLARATQSLFYPEFLPDRARPLGLPWSSAGDRFGGVSETFGTVRYGRLAEILLYDIRRTQTLAGGAPSISISKSRSGSRLAPRHARSPTWCTYRLIRPAGLRANGANGIRTCSGPTASSRPQSPSLIGSPAGSSSTIASWNRSLPCANACHW